MLPVLSEIGMSIEYRNLLREWGVVLVHFLCGVEYRQYGVFLQYLVTIWLDVLCKVVKNTHSGTNQLTTCVHVFAFFLSFVFQI